jgi:hypothetical protein
MSIIKGDEQIKTILDKTGLVRSVSSYDRDYYKTWTNNWGFTDEQILLVAEVSSGKSNPMSYTNKVLATLNEKGIKTDAEIKKELKNVATTVEGSQNKQTFEQRKYTAEELNAVYDSLDDVEL